MLIVVFFMVLARGLKAGGRPWSKSNRADKAYLKPLTTLKVSGVDTVASCGRSLGHGRATLAAFCLCASATRPSGFWHFWHSRVQ
jgi:hypothetical protein